MKHRATGVVAVVLLLSVALFAMPGRGAAQGLPPHLVSLARSLLTDIDDSDFEALGDSPLKSEVLDTLRRSRLQSWQGAAPAVNADVNALSAPLGLDPAKPDQRAALDTVLAANDRKARTEAISAALKLAGKPVTSASLETACAGMEGVIREATAGLATDTEIELDDGRSVGIEWNPVTGDVEITINHGDGRGETVLHGGAVGRIDEEGKLGWKAAADSRPVTYLSPEFQTRITRMVFGVWKGDGATWLVRPTDASEPGREDGALPEKVFEINKLRQRIGELRVKKVYVWGAPDGGRVIQDKYRDLRSLGDYEYLRAESLNYYKEEIANLMARLAELQGTGGREDWFANNDPLGINRSDRSDRKRQPIRISVIQSDGYSFDYDSAAFDGERVTGERTMRDVREFNRILPRGVIDELISSWSPPSWIELKAVYNVRNQTVSLEGKHWALKVSYSRIAPNRVSALNNPYSRPLTLNRADDTTTESNDTVEELKAWFVGRGNYPSPPSAPGGLKCDKDN